MALLHIMLLQIGLTLFNAESLKVLPLCRMNLS